MLFFFRQSTPFFSDGEEESKKKNVCEKGRGKESKRKHRCSRPPHLPKKSARQKKTRNVPSINTHSPLGDKVPGDLVVLLDGDYDLLKATSNELESAILVPVLLQPRVNGRHGAAQKERAHARDDAIALEPALLGLALHEHDVPHVSLSLSLSFPPL